MLEKEKLVDVTKEYYDSKNADEFYHTIWGGEDIHIGIYERENMPILEASHNTVRKMTSQLEGISESNEILDIGSGYGGAARYLVKTFDCKVSCLNLSDVENERNRQKNDEQELSDKITVYGGNFEEIPLKDELFDVVWSQDAILHSDRKDKVFHEAYRLLKKGGTFIFTDPMQADDCPKGVLQPILDRIHLKQLGSVKLYKELAGEVGFSISEIIEMPGQLVNHYSSVLEKLRENEGLLLEKGCEMEYITRMKKGLQHWVDGGKENYLNWGILKMVK